MIALPMHPEIMLRNRDLALRRIRQAMKLAEHRGVRILGLGGLISSLSQGGLLLKENTRLNLTTGHALTAHIVTQNIIQILPIIGESPAEVNIAIVGAAGSISSTSGLILAKAGFKKFTLIDLERKLPKTTDLKKELELYGSNVKISANLFDLKNADYIITATNAPETLVKAIHLSPGAIIVDDAQPSDVDNDVLANENFLVLSGGVVDTPGINTHFNMGLQKKSENYSCMGELLCLAAKEYNSDYVIARATLGDVDTIQSIFYSLGFKLANFQNSNGYITEEQIKHVASLRKRIP
ncbi:MAG: hypothetical protein Q8Q18_00640 [bacterium]|nr:hypothetical protein [bacterium]